MNHASLDSIKQAVLCPTYLPWQQRLLDTTTDTGTPFMHCVIRTKGGEGRGIFYEKVEQNNLGINMPPYKLWDDLMHFASGIPAQSLYIFNIPRCMHKDAMTCYFSEIQQMKSGTIIVKRNPGNCKTIDPPNIIIFTSTEPDVSQMSPNWKFHTITKNE